MRADERMDRAAVLHIPLSQYAFATGERSLTIRLRAKKGDLTCCTLYYADRVCPKTPVQFQEQPMTVCAEDESCVYYEAQVESEFCRVCYYFRLEKEEEWVYYYGDRFTRHLADRVFPDGRIADGRSAYYQYPFILREEIPDVPQWFKTAVVYNIFPDSFVERDEAGAAMRGTRQEDCCTAGDCRSHARLGGTLRAVLGSLDYIQSMGFTCLYLNPIFTAGEYHKYDVLDYYHIDPCLGSDEDFRELVDEVHRRGMRILIDGVFNHCSWYFPQFDDVVKRGQDSRYCHWFYDLTFPVRRPERADERPPYMCFAYERRMPKLNTSEPEVQAYFAEVGAYWVREYHVDGWRLDVANEIDRNFWRRFRAAVKKENPEAVLVGEVWENAETWLRGDAFDSVMNYEFRRICSAYLAEGEADGRETAYQFERMRLRYPTNIVNGQLNLLDSHDVPRFLSMCAGDVQRWRQACVLLMLMPGVPSVFYGDEQEIGGISEEEYRSPMVWRENARLPEFVKRLAEIRGRYLEGSTGYRPLWSCIQDGVFAFVREGRCTLGVLVNARTAAPCPVPEGARVLLCDRVDMGKIEDGGYLVYVCGRN